MRTAVLCLLAMTAAASGRSLREAEPPVSSLHINARISPAVVVYGAAALAAPTGCHAAVPLPDLAPWRLHMQVPQGDSAYYPSNYTIQQHTFTVGAGLMTTPAPHGTRTPIFAALTWDACAALCDAPPAMAEPQGAPCFA